ncbi:MAG: SRPBCC domain-containing protein [Chitinophagaceae bacterium]
MKQEPFVIERTFNASIEKVWEAITDKDQMKQWYFDIPNFRPEAGLEFQFEGGNEDRSYLHLCKVLEVIPHKKIKHNWRYDGYTGNSFVTWELFEEGNRKTRVRLIHEGLETFPPENPDFAKHNFVAGWTQIVGTSLKEFIENRLEQPPNTHH